MKFDEVQIIDEATDSVVLIKEIIKTKDQEDAFYILNISDVISKHRTWCSKMPRVEPYFAMKCNPDPTVVKTLAVLNVGFNCSSKQEIEQALRSGVSSERIIFANTVRPHSHIKFAKKVGVNILTVDSDLELCKIKNIFPDAKIMIRFRCDSSAAEATFGLKCGCDSVTEAPKIIKKAMNLGFRIHGFSFHVGTNCSEIKAWNRGIRISLHLIEYAKSLGLEGVKLIDIGGGFPAHSSHPIDKADFFILMHRCRDVRPISLKWYRAARRLANDASLPLQFAKAINKALDEIDPSIKVISDPGRYYVTSAFTLASIVYGKKIVDECNSPRYMYYVNDGTYGSFVEVMLKLKTAIPRPLNKPASDELHPSTFWGPTCDSFDCVVRDCYFPELNIGDWLVWTEMGAYTLSFAGNFNGMSPSVVFPFITQEDWNSFLKERATDNHERNGCSMEQRIIEDPESFHRSATFQDNCDVLVTRSNGDFHS